MKDTYNDLSTRIEDSFSEIDSDIVIDLRNTNEEYDKLDMQISDLKQHNPFIDKVMEGDGEIVLTAEEHQTLTTYLRLCMKRDDMERQHLYFRRHTDAFSYLKKINML